MALLLLFLLAPLAAGADFPPEEFAARRAKVFDQIGNRAVAIVQGAALPEGFGAFRQANDFYYLTGLETPHSYLLLDGRSRRTTLFLPHRDEARDRNQGKTLSAEDTAEVKKLSGADAVFGVEMLSVQLAAMQIRMPAPAVYVPSAPLQGVMGSRDEILRAHAEVAADPWDGRLSRSAQFISLLRTRFPSLELRDLSPILDELRLVKSPREISLIREASRIAGLGILEAIKRTQEGAFEYELDAAARHVFLSNGAKFEGYGSRHRPIEEIQAELATFRNLPSSYSDEELFSKIMFVVFYSGFRAATVTKKADVIRGHFPDYQTVAGYGEAEVRWIMSDHRMIKNERKIRAVMENARAVQQIVRDHGSFQSFIDSFRPMVSFDATMALKRELQKRFSYLGGITAYHFLTDIGMPVLKPDRVICRIFHRLGLINDETDTHEAVRQGRRFSEETGQPIRYIDIIFVAYGQASSPEFGIDKGICLGTPRCGECRLQKHCRYDGMAAG